MPAVIKLYRAALPQPHYLQILLRVIQEYGVLCQVEQELFRPTILLLQPLSQVLAEAVMCCDGR